MPEYRTITAKVRGFRRCGQAHADRATVWPVDAFTPDQWDRLRADPMLVVVEGAAEGAEELTAPAGEPAPDAFEDRVKAAIRALPAAVYGNNGRPKIDAVRGALAPAEAGSLDTRLLHRLFDEMVKDGFQPPADP